MDANLRTGKRPIDSEQAHGITKRRPTYGVGSHGSMDRDPNHPTKRFEARQLFGDLYLQRAKLLAETMTQSEVQESVQWDDCSRPSPKSSWIRFERWQMYFTPSAGIRSDVCQPGILT